jgi:hypothetical protein
VGDQHVHGLALDVHLFLRDEPGNRGNGRTRRGHTDDAPACPEQSAVSGSAAGQVRADREWQERHRQMHECRV